ncbi:MAG: hypothetical protein LBL13_12850 [Bacteroidales bacterium]|jgi:hypothetical protein|nr:hypothetical protein [Bacteroidales bacterium]
MKKLLFAVIITAVLSSCSKQEKYPDGFNYDLPFGLEYYISEMKADSILDILMEKNILSLPYQGSSSYTYKLPLSDDNIELSVSLRFYNDSLYNIDVREGAILNDRSEKVNYKNAIAFFKAQEINLNSYHKNYDKIWKSSTWNKNKQEITLYSDNSFIINFSDGNISERLLKASVIKGIKETRERNEKKGGVKIQNSSWDGSVRQVEDYLKKTLKDPKSYESIDISYCLLTLVQGTSIYI